LVKLKVSVLALMSDTTKPSRYWSSSFDSRRKRLSPLDSFDHALDVAARQLLLELDAGLGRLLARNLDGLQVQVARSARQALHRDAAHGDLLHQLLVVGVQRIQAVNLVVRVLWWPSSAAPSRP
jgi:hypothetical protein